MVICCFFPGIYSNPLFSPRIQHLRRLGQQMKKAKVYVTLGTE